MTDRFSQDCFCMLKICSKIITHMRFVCSSLFLVMQKNAKKYQKCSRKPHPLAIGDIIIYKRNTSSPGALSSCHTNGKKAPPNCPALGSAALTCKASICPSGKGKAGSSSVHLQALRRKRSGSGLARGRGVSKRFQSVVEVTRDPFGRPKHVVTRLESEFDQSGPLW